jgi:hypothetical protein
VAEVDDRVGVREALLALGVVTLSTVQVQQFVLCVCVCVCVCV